MQHGKLPLHRAVENQTTSHLTWPPHLNDVVAILLPSDVAAKDSTQSYVLLKHFSEFKEQVLAVLLADLSAQKRVVRHSSPANGATVDRDEEIAHTFYSWSKLVSETQDMCIDIVKAILDACKDDAQMLADLLDKDGRKAVDIATPKCKTLLLSCMQLCGRYIISLNPPEHRSATSVVLRAEDHFPRDFSDTFSDTFYEFDRNKNGVLEPKEVADAAQSLGICAKLLQVSDQVVSHDEFVGACKKLIGDGPRQVVIKLMQDQTQWQREKEARVNNMLDNKFVVQTLEGPAEADIAKAVRAGEGGLKYVKDKFLSQELELGTYAIIMDAADRNLHQIFYQERPDMNSIRTILQQVSEAVGHLHGKKLMHGDLKLLNIVRFRFDNRLRLIDLDAAATIFRNSDEDESYAGAKFSSSTLPPELWHCARKEDVDMLKEYWKDCGPELQKKVKPLEGKHNFFVVKSFRSSRDGSPICHGLPYKLVKASEAIDMWALGVVAFLLLTGESFVPSTRDDDCTSGKAATFVYAWGLDPGEVEYHLQKIKDPAGRDFVSKILQRDPLKRLMAHEALQHIFLNPKASDFDAKMTQILEGQHKMAKNQAKILDGQSRIETNIIKLQNLTEATLKQVERSEEVLRKAVFEATEIHTPTCFIILPHKLSDHGDLTEIAEQENAEMQEHLLGIAEEALHTTEEEECGGLGVDGEEEPAVTDCASQTGRPKSMITKAQRKAMLVKNKINQWLSSKIYDTDKTVYLYLVDELTGMPVLCDGDRQTYPIEIRSPKERLRELVPLMCLGITAMSMVSNGASIANMFGIPAPTLSKNAKDRMNSFANKMSKTNTAEQFDCLQESIADAQQPSSLISADQKKHMRGNALRTFERFLDEYDHENNYAGLRRVMTKLGNVV